MFLSGSNVKFNKQDSAWINGQTVVGEEYVVEAVLIEFFPAQLGNPVQALVLTKNGKFDVVSVFDLEVVGYFK